MINFNEISKNNLGKTTGEKGVLGNSKYREKNMEIYDNSRLCFLYPLKVIMLEA